MPDGSTRVFWISSLFVVFGLYHAARSLLRKWRWRDALLVALFASAIYVTQTRALVLGVPLAIVGACALYWVLTHTRLPFVIIVLMVMSALVSVTFFQSAAASGQLTGLLGLDRGDSDDMRSYQIGFLIDAWLENPLFGNGFGSKAAWVRSEAAPFSYEMSILALYMKVGLLGAIVSCAYFVYLVTSLIPARAAIRANAPQWCALFAAVYILCFAFNTNPYLTNSVGVAIVLVCCIELTQLSNEAAMDAIAPSPDARGRKKLGAG
jgi:hypothetical protein